MTKVKFCKDCKWSRESSYGSMKCINPVLNSKDAWALAYPTFSGTDCRPEREKSWLQFPSCGMSGKLWEIRLDSSAES